LVLSIMGVRALGETDLNPVSGISKLAQLFFALIIPQSHKSSVLINLIAGAVVCTLNFTPLPTTIANEIFTLVRSCKSQTVIMDLIPKRY
jgi:ABC-type glucose/galactose transport system permease subunit